MLGLAVEKNVIDYDAVYNGLRLGLVDCYLYLGIKVDRNLTFEKQMDSTIGKVNTRWVTFAVIHKFMSYASSCLVYKQTIVPYFDYVSPIAKSSSTNSTVNKRKIVPIVIKAQNLV